MDDKAGISLGEDWDSTMQCYPYVIELEGKLLMFFITAMILGQTGIGICRVGGGIRHDRRDSKIK